jgi:hypothetical protein
VTTERNSHMGKYTKEMGEYTKEMHEAYRKGQDEKAAREAEEQRRHGGGVTRHPLLRRDRGRAELRTTGVLGSCAWPRESSHLSRYVTRRGRRVPPFFGKVGAVHMATKMSTSLGHLSR